MKSRAAQGATNRGATIPQPEGGTATPDSASSSALPASPAPGKGRLYAERPEVEEAASSRMEDEMDFARFSRDEMAHVERIINRGEHLLLDHPDERRHIPRIELIMDLAAVHAQYPLRLEEFADAADGDFAHDFCGIRYHLDRTSGLLRDCFVPRHSR